VGTRCGSGSDGSKLDVKHGSFSKNGTTRIIFVFSIRIYNNFYYTKSLEKRLSDLMLTRAGAETGAGKKIVAGAA
jgi:hypothetical protein